MWSDRAGRKQEQRSSEVLSALRRVASQHVGLVHPAPLDQFAVQDGDLSGWSAEADESQLEPEQAGLSETDRIRAGADFHGCDN